METLPSPRKPLIVSQLSARLLSEHRQAVQSQNIMDGDGLIWKLRVEQSQKPHPEDPRALRWILSMSLESQVSVQELQDTGTLCPEKDERLISLVRAGGDDKIRICLKPGLVEANDEDEVIRLARKALPDYIEKIAEKSLHDMKRKVIFRLIEKRCSFG